MGGEGQAGQAASGQNGTQRIDCGCGRYVVHVHQTFCMYYCTTCTCTCACTCSIFRGNDCQVVSHEKSRCVAVLCEFV